MSTPIEHILNELDLLWKQTAIEHFAARDSEVPGKRYYLLGLGNGIEKAIKIVRHYDGVPAPPLEPL